MPHKTGEYKTYAQKMHRANREALYAVAALAIIVVAWLLGGVGLAGVDIQVASTPLWIIGGTVGTWLVAVVIAIVFAKRVFANFDLDADDPAQEDAPTGDTATTSNTPVSAPNQAGDPR